MNKDYKNYSESQLPKTAEITEEVEEVINPDKTDEILWFALKNGETKCKIGLSDVLACIKFAERIGEIPPLPSCWWSQIEGLYNREGNFSLE